MEWLNISSVEELKKLGKMRQVMQRIKDDIEKLFHNKKSVDKNIVTMISIKSNSWAGLYQKILAFREVITYLNDNIVKPNNEERKIQIDNYDPGYFTSKEAEYIYYLLELDGKDRAEKLRITMKCYSNKREAKNGEILLLRLFILIFAKIKGTRTILN